MVLITDIRRGHLQKAIEQCGGVNGLARRLGVKPPTIYGLLNGSRNVGHKTARKIEAAMGWDTGAMDAPDAALDKELASLLSELPEDEVVSVLRSVIRDLSPRGAQIVARAILQRVALDDE